MNEEEYEELEDDGPGDHAAPLDAKVVVLVAGEVDERVVRLVAKDVGGDKAVGLRRRADVLAVGDDVPDAEDADLAVQ